MSVVGFRFFRSSDIELNRDKEIDIKIIVKI
jgi:hypothetical protein